MYKKRETKGTKNKKDIKSSLCVWMQVHEEHDKHIHEQKKKKPPVGHMVWTKGSYMTSVYV